MFQENRNPFHSYVFFTHTQSEFRKHVTDFVEIWYDALTEK